MHTPPSVPLRNLYFQSNPSLGQFQETGRRPLRAGLTERSPPRSVPDRALAKPADRSADGVKAGSRRRRWRAAPALRPGRSPDYFLALDKQLSFSVIRAPEKLRKFSRPGDAGPKRRALRRNSYSVGARRGPDLGSDSGSGRSDHERLKILPCSNSRGLAEGRKTALG
jgi:hypothetical protein